MTEELEKDPEPLDDYTLRRLLRDGAIPAKVQGSGKELDYDLKFYWSRIGNQSSSFGHRLYFGLYFRDPNLKVTSFTIGPGKPYKTESIIVLLDPPTEKDRFAINTYHEGKEHGKGRHSPGCINSKPLLELFFKTAKECGIELPVPKFVGDTIVITCTLHPYIKDKIVNPKICILRIDHIEHRK